MASFGDGIGNAFKGIVRAGMVLSVCVVVLFGVVVTLVVSRCIQ